ncbi:MAG: flagellar hook-associated protein FlgL [Proteobacteria bacterium]|nr:flagellar hook-associated protein FlgL [Pseudomonadota bacterium]
MRISTQTRFTFFIGNMNDALSELMELNIKASTQKDINRPSDNPVGMARILDHRETIAALDQYAENINTATGWLGFADSTLTRTNEILTRIRVLAEQAATGTMSGNNREQASYEVRQLNEELVVLANSKYEQQYIFSGHNTGEQAYENALWLTDNDGATDGTTFSITGDSNKTVLVRFTTAGVVGTDALDYEYSSDGGTTFTAGTVPAVAGDKTLILGGVQLTLEAGTTVTAYDPDVAGDENNGTWMWVRPTARYKGDDNDAISVDTFGPSLLSNAASGIFTKNVTVRIDSDAALDSDPVEYSYSTDGGSTWVEGQTTNGSGSATELSLVVPGGTLTLYDSGSGNTLSAGDQWIIRPRTADVRMEISPGENIIVNNVGKDIFGGIYQDPSSSGLTLAPGVPADQNMFDTVGRLIGFMETNNQGGCQEALAELTPISERIMNYAARVGAAENRLQVASGILDTMRDNEKERLSSVEDADVTELMTNLANQQVVYETVLRSSSMVMRMSLVNFI